MNEIINIECEYGLIKGHWVNNGISFDFNGSLFENETNTLNIEFSVPFSFIKKYGKQTVLDEIRISVEGYIKTTPSKLGENA